MTITRGKDHRHKNMQKPVLLVTLALILALTSATTASISAFMLYNAGTKRFISSQEVLTIPLTCLAAAMAVSVSCLAAGLALRAVVTAGFAASAERPELRGLVMIMGGLAEGIAIYGLLVAILILMALH
ncbi:MAG: hypothetical protein DRN15_06570 [Thermoprotei archaeon]|nr:MAG: hypothetical protein DRM97_05260 [Thermoprotei archaeon]RLF23366.1 MAG: hypothetical protein DRN15_06570 [Thermoprotei archaeon]